MIDVRIPLIPPRTDALSVLRGNRLVRDGEPVRLHLGCGGVKLAGYVNLDYPASEHSVQTDLAADATADIASLRFPAQSVDEVRLHHVFEHFDRPLALALLCHWHLWLRPTGVLTIETPDLIASARQLIYPWYGFAYKQAVVRHVFGSHEAHWGVHRDGWYAGKFRRVLGALGFGALQVQRTKWKMLRNLVVSARKVENLDFEMLRTRCVEMLRESLVDEGASETRLWKVWQGQLDAALEGSP